MKRQDPERGLHFDKDVRSIFMSGYERYVQPTELKEGGQKQEVLLEGDDAPVFVNQEEALRLLNRRYDGFVNIDAIDEAIDEEDFYQRQYMIHQSFARKVFGIYSCQLAIMTLWIWLCLSRAVETREKRKIDGAYKDNLCKNKSILIGAIITAFVSLCCVLHKELRRMVPVNFIFALLFTLSLSYSVGYLVYDFNRNIVQIALILTLTLSFALTCLGANIIKFLGVRNGNKITNSLRSALGIFGILVVVTLFVCLCTPLGKGIGVLNSVFMFLALFVAFQYMLIDTWAIVTGKYDRMISTDDYIYAACKLYADFVLCLGLLLKLFQ